MLVTLIVIAAVGVSLLVCGFLVRAHLNRMRAQLSERDREIERVRTDAARAEERSAAELEMERARTPESIALIEDAKRELSSAFHSTCHQALETNNRAFLDLAETKLGEFTTGAQADLEARQNTITEMVRPVMGGLAEIGRTLQRLDIDRATGRAAIEEQLSSIGEHSRYLATETHSLVRALRTPTTRGRWGELQLRRVIELAGMVAHVDYTEQPSIATDDGRRRPDLIVHLPGGKEVVVDSKAPLDAFMDSVAATDDETRAAALQRHAQQVRQHVTSLAGRQYDKHVTDGPDFVVMFVPGECFLSAALESDPNLIEFAIAKGVMLSSPLTLIALLKAVAFGWRQEKLAQNTGQLRDLGRTLYDRVGTLTGHLQTMRSGLERAVMGYNKCVGSLESRVLPAARRFVDMGVSVDREIPHLEPIDEVPREPQAEVAAAPADAFGDFLTALSSPDVP